MDDNQRAEFGAWLRTHREALKMNQTQAGRKAKVSRTQWTRYELGESGPKYATIPRIAEAVNADLHETYRRAGFDPPKDPASGFAKSRLESILRRSNKLKPTLRKELEKLIEMVERELDRLEQQNNPRAA